MKKLVIFLALFILFCKALFAMPAYPDPITFTQPDGETLTVLIKGDERIHWHETMDGYTLLFNKAGYLSYARLDENGNMQPSDVVATDVAGRNAEVNSFLRTIEKKLFYSDVQKQLMFQVWEIEDEVGARGEKVAVTGLYKTLCAFVQFPEKAMTKSMSDFEGLMNQLGYTGNGTGSVRDYFRESSYGQFDLIITLCGVYTAPQSESYYAGSDGSALCNLLARWLALQVAADPNINFADYDSDNDGMVDGFHFIFAGRGQEAGGGSSTIWSHKWSFSPSVTQNGKAISIYSCSPELYNSDITTIGAICHEMTHAFGASDFYDTNSSTGGQYDGTGRWDIMANGSWNGSPNGNCPPHHNMYIKVQFGWVNPVVLNGTTTVTDMPNSAENPIAYRINTTTNNEYYLLENRQQIKFDAYVPGNGLLIYHVHSYVGTSGINDTHPQRMYPVCASSTYSVPTGLGTYGSINSAGCPFPGTSNKTAFTDVTTPSMKSWANANTNNPITNITHTNRLISFNFAPVTHFITASAGANGTITPQGLISATPGSNQKFTFTPNSGYIIANVLIDNVSNPEAVAAGSYTFTNITASHTIAVYFGCPEQSMPIVESFDGVGFPPNCWMSESASGTPWKRVTASVEYSNPPCSPHTGAGMLLYESWSYNGESKGLLITPKIVTDTLNSILTFWMYRDNVGSNGAAAYKDRVNVYLSATPSIAGLSPAMIIHRCRDLAPVENANGWYQYSLELATATMNSAYVIFEGVADWGNNIYLDDIAIELKQISETTTQTIQLKEGWNWISVNVLSTTPSILNQIKSSLGEVGEIIKGYSTYITYNAPYWVGSLTAISEKEMYEVLVTDNHTLTLTGAQADPADTPITLSPGWNWIGYIPDYVAPLSYALSGVPAQDGDIIKDKTYYATYYSFEEGGGVWVGSLTTLQPGCGYQYYSNSAGTVTFYYYE